MPITQRTASPVGEYSPYYMKTGTYTGALNNAILGYPQQAGANVLANCVGYANGRFAEIRGKGDIPYQFTGNANTFVTYANSYGLTVDTTPEEGAIMCWNSDSYGHVAVVEEVINNDTVIASESNYGATTTARVWQRVTRYRSGVGGVPWAQYTDLTAFLGFIHNPDITPPIVYYDLTGYAYAYYKGKYLVVPANITGLGTYEENTTVSVSVPYAVKKDGILYTLKNVMINGTERIGKKTTFNIVMDSYKIITVEYIRHESKFIYYGNIYRNIGVEI